MLNHPPARKWLILASFILGLSLITWQVSIALADAPAPNPLPSGSSVYSPVPGADTNKPGPAASIHGDPVAGRTLFAQDCAGCHGARGTGGVDNPGSDDGTVPSLNPIDPGFLDDSQGDPAIFAQEMDLFVQHGSRPSGDNPKISMVGWGDHNLLSQNQLADIEAYVMQLNGVWWSDKWAPPAEIQMQATRSGDTIVYSMTLINQSPSDLTNLDLKDTLPPGLSYVTSYISGPGQNPGAWSGSTVEWINEDGVPQGGTLGPFIIVAKPTGATVPPNIAQLIFDFNAWDGTGMSSSVVSPSTSPADSTPTPTPIPIPATPTVAAPTPAPEPQATAPTIQPPAPSATVASPVAAPSVISANIVEPAAGVMSWGYDPATITAHIGDTVVWTNTGDMAHTVTADDGSFDSGSLSKGDSWSHIFNTAGTFTYYCAPHPWMKGTVIVR